MLKQLKKPQNLMDKAYEQQFLTFEEMIALGWTKNTFVCFDENYVMYVIPRANFVVGKRKPYGVNREYIN